MILKTPNSSSKVRNTTPLAVPGFWRTKTNPATVTTEPLGGRFNLFCGNAEGGLGQSNLFELISVSYTHLTLPTILLV